MTLKLPALDPATVPEVRGTTFFPEPFRSRFADRAKRKLGDACGLSQFGVNLVTLGPGSESALRHWHNIEDELVYVLSGEVVLRTDDGEQVLRAGMCAGFPGGKRDAHQLVNRSEAPAQYLEIGGRVNGDTAFYPDDDVMWVEVDGESRLVRKELKPLSKP